MSEIAGRLEVLVESELAGFGQKLKKKVEAASKDIKAKIGVDVDSKSLRSKLERAVNDAGKGLKVKIGVELQNGDVARVKAELAALGKNAEVKVKVTADGSKLEAETAAEVAAIEKGARPSIKVRLQAVKDRLIGDVLKARAEAQAAAKADPIEIPVKAGKFDGRKFFRVLKFGAIASLVSVIEPAIGALGSLVTGLTAVVGAAAPAVGTLAAIPITIGSVVQAVVAGKIAFGGLGDAVKALDEKQQSLASGTKLTAEQQDKLDKTLKSLSPSARKVAKDLVSLKSGWMGVRNATQEAFFKPVVDDIKPLAKTLLPLLRTGLSGTSKVLGESAHNAALFAETPLFQRQFAGIMRQNNGTLAAGAGALGNVGKGVLYLYRAAAPFQRRFNGVITSVGEFFEKTSRENAKNGDFADFLKLAGDRGKQLLSITKNLGSGFGGIFSAAAGSGERLLTSFDKFTGDWAKWTHSNQGRNYLTTYFDKAEGNFRSVAKLANSTFKGLAKYAADPKIKGMVDQIRTDLGPALGKIFETLGKNVAPHTIDLISSVAKALAGIIGPMSKLVGFGTAAIAAPFKGLNFITKNVPGAADAIGTLAGAFILYKTATKGLKVVKSLGNIGKGGKLASLFNSGTALGSGSKGGVVPVYVTNMGALGGGGVDKNGKPIVTGPGKTGRPVIVPPTRVPKTPGSIFTEDGRLVPRAPIVVPKSRFPKVRNLGSRLRGSGAGGNAALLAASLGSSYVGSKIGGGGGRILAGAGNGAAIGALAASVIPIPVVSQGVGGAVGGFAGGIYAAATNKRGKAGTGQGMFADVMNSKTQIKSMTALSATYKKLASDRDKLSGGDAKRYKELAANPGPARENMEALDKTANALYDTLSKGDQKLLARSGKNPLKGLGKDAEETGQALKKVSDERVASAKKEAAAKRVEAMSKAGIPGLGGKKGGDFSVGVDVSGSGPAAVKALGASFKALPKQVQTKISTPGSIKSRADVTALAKQFKLTPKQVKTIMKALGFDEAGKKAKDTGKAMDNLGKKRPHPKATFDDKVSDRAKEVGQQLDNLGQKRPKPAATLTDKVSGVVGDLVGKLTGLGHRTAKPTASVNDQASGKLAGISSQISGLDGRRATSTIDIITNRVTNFTKRVSTLFVGGAGAKGGLWDAAKGFVRRYADGGPVKGKGTGTSDSILARIANGEYVVPAKFAKIYRKILDKMRVGQYDPEEDVDAYATGGSVRKKKKRKPLSKAARRAQIRRLDSSLRNGLESKGEYSRDTKIIRARFSGATEKNLLKRLDRLWDIGKKQLKVQDKLEKAQNKLANLREGRANIKSSLKTAGQEFGSLSGVASDNSGFLKPGFTIAELGRRLKEQRQFRTLLAQLQKKGLKKAGYEQIASLGAQEGLPLAQQLANATPAEIKKINQLQSSITKAATNTGKDAAKAYYNAGIKAAAGLVKGLKSQSKALEKVAEGIGKSMVKGIKKALKIKSPSRVMYGLGVFTGKGLGDGLKSQQKHVAKRATDIADVMRRNMTVEQKQTLNVSSMRRNAMLANRATTQPAVVNHNSAPLVGSVDMRGMDPRAAHDNLQELMFQLRVLKGGGVHADRVA